MLLEILVIGALMGILGQGARAIIGLKGMADDAKAQGLSPNDLFEAGRLLTSFLIGIVVGLASVLVYLKSGGSATADPTWQIMLAWAVSAYAGTDFLEGFISQYLSSGTTSKKTPVAIPAATLDALSTQIALKTPTYSKAQATKIVITAFNALNKPGVVPSDTLGNPPISFNTSGFTGLYVQINNAINDIKNEFVQDIINTWSATTTVDSIITQVMWAPTGTSG